MTILFALLPLSLITVFSQKHVIKLLQYISVTAAAGLLLWNMSLNRDVKIIMPPLFFLVLLGHQKFFKKSLTNLEFMGALFLAQALLLTKTSQVLMLVVVSEVVFLLSQNNIKTIFRQTAVWFPLIFGIILNKQGNVFIALCALSLILKNAQWPWKFEFEKGNTEIYEFVSKVIIPLAIWKTVSVEDRAVWTLIWMIVPVIFGWGSEFRRMLTPFLLGLWTASPLAGDYGVFLWGLYFLQGYWAIVTLLGVASVGYLTQKRIDLLIYEVQVLLAVLQGLSLSRLIVMEVRRPLSSPKPYYISLCLLTLLSGGIFAYWEPEIEFTWEVFPLIFSVNMIVFAGIFWVLSTKKQKWFIKLKATDPVEKALVYCEKFGERIYVSSGGHEFVEQKLIIKFFGILETEAYLIFIMGLAAGALFWSMR